MNERSSARVMLEKARFFADRARKAGSPQRDEFVNFFEAAIVFARSTTFHLQAEYRNKPGFEEWYSAQQKAMRTDPVCQLFLKQRNFILKQGPASLHKKTSIAIADELMISDVVRIKVIRGKPWYRRHPKIIWEDVCRMAMEPIRRSMEQRETRRRLRSRKHSKAEATEDFFFDDSRWRDIPALNLFLRYLTKLESVVDDADTRFGNDNHHHFPT